MNTKQIGAKVQEKALTLAGLSDYVTLWAVPVWFGPRQRAVIDFLKAQGYASRARGHYLQIRVSADDPTRVEDVTAMVKNFKGAAQ